MTRAVGEHMSAGGASHVARTDGDTFGERLITTCQRRQNKVIGKRKRHASEEESGKIGCFMRRLLPSRQRCGLRRFARTMLAFYSVAVMSRRV